MNQFNNWNTIFYTHYEDELKQKTRTDHNWVAPFMLKQLNRNKNLILVAWKNPTAVY
jgi:hypothetical protein